jgi:hypothetical protein
MRYRLHAPAEADHLSEALGLLVTGSSQWFRRSSLAHSECASQMGDKALPSTAGLTVSFQHGVGPQPLRRRVRDLLRLQPLGFRDLRASKLRF